MHKIGIIGLDTSHVSHFANLLHDASHAHHVQGARIVAAFPGGSPDFATSANRVGLYTEELQKKHEVSLFAAIEDLPTDLDAILLESVDGRQHLEQFRRILDREVPVFIDKPLACSVAEAGEIVKAASAHKVPLMSCSALRFAEAFRKGLGKCGDGPILGGDFFGPMAFVDGCPGYFWYGIHLVEMLFAAFGRGCRRLRAVSNENHDVITAEWSDGRLATVRGNRAGNSAFGGTLHTATASVPFLLSPGGTPYYASLLSEVIRFLETRRSPVETQESLEIIAFLEAANKSRGTGDWKDLCGEDGA